MRSDMLLPSVGSGGCIQDPTAVYNPNRKLTEERRMAVPEGLFDVRGARVLVTGAASGLGLAMAEVMVDGGASVTLADVDEPRLEEVASGLRERDGGDVRTVTLDVADRAQVDAAVDGIVADQGGLDVAFANAGIS